MDDIRSLRDCSVVHKTVSAKGISEYSGPGPAGRL